jgi:hypothetical protein
LTTGNRFRPPSQRVGRVVFPRWMAFCWVCVAVIGCVAAEPLRLLEETAAKAKRLLATVRPAARIDDVRVEVFSTARARSALARARTKEDFFDVEAILRTQLAIPVALGVLDQGEADALIGEFSSRDVRMTDADGVAIGSEALVLVVPDKAGSLRVVAHELAHIASERLGYFSNRIQTAFPAALSPKRIDLDALLMLWAIVEGDAEFSAMAVESLHADGAEGLANLWGSRFPADLSSAGPSLSGPASFTTPDGTIVELKAGETYAFPPASLYETLTHFVYKMSPRLIQLQRRRDGTLEDAICSVWQNVPLHSRFLLSPTSETPKAGLLAEIRGGVGDDDQTSRLGAVLMWDFLLRKARLAPQRASAIVVDFVDDLALRRADAAAWMTRWRTEASAATFADHAGRIGKSIVRSRDREDRHIVVWGDAALMQALGW